MKGVPEVDVEVDINVINRRDTLPVYLTSILRPDPRPIVSLCLWLGNKE